MLGEGRMHSGIFSIVGKQVQVSLVVKDPVLVDIPSMAQGDDWQIVHGWRLDAQLVSNSQCVTLSLNKLCRNAGVPLGSEPVEDLTLDLKDIPSALQLLLGQPHFPSTSPTGHKLPKNGDGKVVLPKGEGADSE
jgi:hypothetical protein